MLSPQLLLVSPHSKKFRLLEDWISYSPDGDKIIVPKGFITDLASVPRPFFWWQWGKYNLAAIVHDWGYINHSLMYLMPDGSFDIVKISRKFCDRLFYNQMLADGVNPITAWCMYAAVRLYSNHLWQGDRRDTNQLTRKKNQGFTRKISYLWNYLAPSLKHRFCNQDNQN